MCINSDDTGGGYAMAYTTTATARENSAASPLLLFPCGSLKFHSAFPSLACFPPEFFPLRSAWLPSNGSLPIRSRATGGVVSSSDGAGEYAPSQSERQAPDLRPSSSLVENRASAILLQLWPLLKFRRQHVSRSKYD